MMLSSVLIKLLSFLIYHTVWWYSQLIFNGFFNSIDNVADIVVGDVGAGREADADFEECFRHAVNIGRSILIHRLFVHWLPEWSCLDIGFVEAD